jgi:hypothetical protein
MAYFHTATVKVIWHIKENKVILNHFSFKFKEVLTNMETVQTIIRKHDHGG